MNDGAVFTEELSLHFLYAFKYLIVEGGIFNFFDFCDSEDHAPFQKAIDSLNLDSSIKKMIKYLDRQPLKLHLHIFKLCLDGISLHIYFFSTL